MSEDNTAARAPFLTPAEQGEVGRRAGSAVPLSAQVVLEDRGFYRMMAKRAIWLVVLQGICLALVVVAAVYLATRPVTTLSYLTDSEGRVVEMVPVDMPTASDASVLIWATDRVADVQGLAFSDYREHILGLRRYFTPDAFQEYQEALAASRVIDKIVKDRLVSWVRPTLAPTIIDKGVVDGHLTYVVEVRFVQFFEGGDISTRTQEQVARLVIRRASRTINPAGLLLAQYLVRNT